VAGLASGVEVLWARVSNGERLVRKGKRRGSRGAVAVPAATKASILKQWGYVDSLASR
jgi:hypothetical protein